MHDPALKLLQLCKDYVELHEKQPSLNRICTANGIFVKRLLVKYKDQPNSHLLIIEEIKTILENKIYHESKKTSKVDPIKN